MIHQEIQFLNWSCEEQEQLITESCISILRTPLSVSISVLVFFFLLSWLNTMTKSSLELKKCVSAHRSRGLMVKKDTEMSQGDIAARVLKPSWQFICTQEAESEQEVGPGSKPQIPTPMTYFLQSPAPSDLLPPKPKSPSPVLYFPIKARPPKVLEIVLTGNQVFKWPGL